VVNRSCLIVLLFALPPVTSAQTFVPLSAHERWQRYWDESVLSPGLYFASLGAAAGGQLANEPREWKQGLEGYGRRSASNFGLFLMQTTIHEGAAAASGYDPRYSRCECRGALRRTRHAIVWSFVTRNREGRLRPDIPAISAAYGSGMLATYWYPSRFSPLTDGVRTGNQQLGFQIGVNVIREFGPEIKRAILRRP
jgi:hypothetical protein